MRLAIPVLIAATLMLAACSRDTGETAINAPAIPDDIAFETLDNSYAEAPPAMAALDAAFERAARRNTRVLAVFGGDWCPDCRIFGGMLTIPALAEFVDAHFEVVKIDAERTGELNADAIARFGYDEGLTGYPTVVVVTADGEVVNRAGAAEWRTARERRPQEVADWLAALVTAPVPADAGRVDTGAGGA
ncbi:MAG: thioredoxin family protein [Oceanicaulis sp.]